VVVLFRRRKRLQVEEIADALIEPIRGYARHKLTTEELAERHAEALAAIYAQGELGRISADEVDRIVDAFEVLDPPGQYVMLIRLHSAFAMIKGDPIGTYGRRIVAARGLRMLTECAESALSAGKLDEAAGYVDSAQADTWEAESFIPDGFWLSAKAHVLQGLGRTDDARTAARQGEQVVRQYLDGDEAARLDTDLRQMLTEVADVLHDQAQDPGR
jgi:hypothetical protein